MTTTERYHALDAVRGYALLAGIVLHATMSFFLAIPIADHSPSSALKVTFFVIHTFRMTLFFVIAGFFARLLLQRRGVTGFIRHRSARILAPLLVAWAVLTPVTLRILAWADPASAHGWRPVPLMHLWFLYYLCLFYVAALALRWITAQRSDGGEGLAELADGAVRRLLDSPLAPWVLALPLFAVLGFDDRILWGLGIPTPDRGLTPKPPVLVAFGTAFALGWFVHRQPAQLQKWRARWREHLAVGMTLTGLCLTVLHVEQGATDGWLFHSAAGSRAVYVACYLASIWYWTFGVTGAALRYCADESPVRRYLADSSYWLYLVHLPLVFFLQVAFAPLAWPWAIKFSLIMVIALTLLFLSYHYFVRSTWIGEVLNGARYPRRALFPSRQSRPTAPSALQPTRHPG